MAPATLRALIFSDNEDGEDFIVISHKDFIPDWVHWDKANDDYDECVKAAWDYLCSKCDEVANGEGYINIAYDEDDEDDDIESKVGAMVTQALAYAENLLDENAADDPV